MWKSITSEHERDARAVSTSSQTARMQPADQPPMEFPAFSVPCLFDRSSLVSHFTTSLVVVVQSSYLASRKTQVASVCAWPFSPECPGYSGLVGDSWERWMGGSVLFSASRSEQNHRSEGKNSGELIVIQWEGKNTAGMTNHMCIYMSLVCGREREKWLTWRERNEMKTIQRDRDDWQYKITID